MLVETIQGFRGIFREIILGVLHGQIKPEEGSKAGHIVATRMEEKFPGTFHGRKKAFDARIKALEVRRKNNSKFYGGDVMLELFRDGNRFGLVTDSGDERTFTQQFATALQAVIVKEASELSRSVVTENWLKQFTEVVLKMRGYKANVRTRQLIEAGEFSPGNSSLEAKVDDQGEVSIPEHINEDQSVA